MRCTLLLLVLTCLTHSAAAQQNASTWRTGAAPTEGITPADLPILEATGTRFLLGELTGPVTPSLRRQLQQAGVRLQQPLGGGRFFVRLEGVRPQPVARIAGLRLQTLSPIQKQHPLLVDNPGSLVRWHATTVPDLEPRIPLYLVLHQGVTLTRELRFRLESLGLRLGRTLDSLNVVVATGTTDMLPAIARVDEIAWIEPALPPLGETNDRSLEAAGVIALRDEVPGLDGSGVRTFIFDSGVAAPETADFAGRRIQIDDASASNHSTHVAGTVAGSGALSDGQYQGVAPAAALVVAGLQPDPNAIFFYLDPADIEQDYDLAINEYAVDVANNSLGTNTEANDFPCEIQGDYGVAAGLLDAIVRGSLGRPLPIVFAAGNERNSPRCDVEGFGDYYSTSPPAAAKNTITVGALNSNNDTLAVFSSWGPSDDGRIRPDVCAPGCQSNEDQGVTSPINPFANGTLCGTSMASPVVTGIIALVLQDLRDQGVPDPLPSFYRALLAHTARDLEQPGPDYRSGFGAVDAVEAVRVARAQLWHQGVIRDGQRQQFFVEVSESEIVKLTLGWDDAPSAFNVVPNLVNDLDVRVFGPDGERHWPWTLDPFEPAAAATRQQPDRLNNLEQVLIDLATPGVYTVEVVGHAVPVGPQSFTLHSTHALLDCPPGGVPRIGVDAVRCGGQVELQLSDCGEGSTRNVTWETTGSVPQSATLVRDPNAPVFRGIIEVPEALEDGAALTVAYDDPDFGSRQIAAPIECGDAPEIEATPIAIEATRAVVRVTTSRPTRLWVEYGAECGTPRLQVTSPVFASEHDVTLRDLIPENGTVYRIVAETPGGVASELPCQALQTPALAPLLAEEFLFDFDLTNKLIRYTPRSDGQYDACLESIGSLPVPPLDGVDLEMAIDSTRFVPLGDDQLLYFFGRAYDGVTVSSRGYVGFDAVVTGSGGLTGHFAIPGVSALQGPLDPNASGSVRALQLEDRLVLTWQRVATVGRPDERNTVQIGLLFNGEIEVAYRRVDAFYSVSGISEGRGLVGDFEPSDLSELPTCEPAAPFTRGYVRQGLQGDPLLLRLGMVDQPDRVETVTLLQLPSQPLRWNETLLTAEQLPLTFPPGEVTLWYEPDAAFVGLDGLQFSARNDLGADGGTGEIRIEIAPRTTVPLLESFDAMPLASETWNLNDGVEIDAQAVDPPDGGLSAHLNGAPDGGDVLRSQRLQLDDVGPVLLTYQWQAGGRAAPPGPRASLRFEARGDDGSWQLISEHIGGEEATAFQRERRYLPTGALHRGGQFRIVSRGDLGPVDDWFVDSLSLVPSTEPLAFRGFARTTRDRDVAIGLTGFDPLERPFAYVITSLPRRGVLLDEKNVVVTQVPHVLTGEGIWYRPAARTLGEDQFQFAVNNGTQQSESEPFTITIENRVALHAFPLDRDPGWVRGEHWSFGPLPPGGGSPDPNAAYEGDNVFGNVLGGLLPGELVEPDYLTTPLLPLRNRTEPELIFQRWLTKGFQDMATLDISTDGVNWEQLWPARDDMQINDRSWLRIRYELPDAVVKAGQVAFRWSIGPTSQLPLGGGWNLDEIELWVDDLPCPADLDGGGQVDTSDLLILLTHFGEQDALGPEYGDLNADGVINLTDLAILLQQFSQSCP